MVTPLALGRGRGTVGRDRGVQWLLRIELPIWGLLALVGFTAATNAVYSFWLDIVRRRTAKSDSNTPTYHLVACLMLVDLLTLTGMLWMSGSLQNPFALFYFVNIAVAGVILTPVWAWSLWIGAVVCVLILMFFGETLPRWPIKVGQPLRVGRSGASVC